MTINSWLFKRNNSELLLKQCLDNSIMTLGWPGVTVDSKHFGEQYIIRQQLQKQYDYLKDNKSAGRVAGHFRRFLGEVRIGDYIVFPLPGKLYIAKIAGDPIADTNNEYEDCSYYRAVEWLNGGEPVEKKGNINQLLWGKTTNRSASCYLAGCTEHIESVLRHESNAYRVNQAIIENLHRCLQGSIRATELENWVGALFKKMGARVEMTRGPNERGVDVMATFSASHVGQLHDLFGINTYGMTEDNQDFVVACQVKQHRAEEGPAGIQQLVRGLEQRIAGDEEIHAALLITTADDISDEVQSEIHRWGAKPDETCNLQVWDGMTLAENILRAHGLIDFVAQVLPR